jgi:hypothetical protein
MSFTVVLQTNSSPKNQLDKSLTGILSLTGNLKENSSIVDPVILVQAPLSTIAAANYMTISAFNRSYFITDMVSVRNSLVEIHGHCDVLSSFSAGIRSNTAIVYRQENDWNLYLDDGSFQVYNNPMVLTRPFPSGFTTLEFVLAVAGAATTSQQAQPNQGGGE